VKPPTEQATQPNTAMAAINILPATKFHGASFLVFALLTVGLCRTVSRIEAIEGRERPSVDGIVDPGASEVTRCDARRSTSSPARPLRGQLLLVGLAREVLSR
jgi:hypothetical protein